MLKLSDAAELVQNELDNDSDVCLEIIADRIGGCAAWDDGIKFDGGIFVYMLHTLSGWKIDSNTTFKA